MKFQSRLFHFPIVQQPKMNSITIFCDVMELMDALNRVPPVLYPFTAFYNLVQFTWGFVYRVIATFTFLSLVGSIGKSCAFVFELATKVKTYITNHPIGGDEEEAARETKEFFFENQAASDKEWVTVNTEMSGDFKFSNAVDSLKIIRQQGTFLHTASLVSTASLEMSFIDEPKSADSKPDQEDKNEVVSEQLEDEIDESIFFSNAVDSLRINRQRSKAPVSTTEYAEYQLVEMVEGTVVHFAEPVLFSNSSLKIIRRRSTFVRTKKDAENQFIVVKGSVVHFAEPVVVNSVGAPVSEFLSAGGVALDTQIDYVEDATVPTGDDDQVAVSLGQPTLRFILGNESEYDEETFSELMRNAAAGYFHFNGAKKEEDTASSVSTISLEADEDALSFTDEPRSVDSKADQENENEVVSEQLEDEEVKVNEELQHVVKEEGSIFTNDACKEIVLIESLLHVNIVMDQAFVHTMKTGTVIDFYRIVVEGRNATFEITRRFSEFVQLVNDMQSELKENKIQNEKIPDLPSRFLISQLTQEKADKLKLQLQFFVDAVTEDEVLSNLTSTCTFFQPQFTTSTLKKSVLKKDDEKILLFK